MYLWSVLQYGKSLTTGKVELCILDPTRHYLAASSSMIVQAIKLVDKVRL